MVEPGRALDTVFHALAHEARRGILARLADGELTIGELAEPLTMSLPAVSKHLTVLERAGLIRRSVTGRRHLCRLEAAPLASATEWLSVYESHWTGRLDALERLFAPVPAEEGHT